MTISSLTLKLSLCNGHFRNHNAATSINCMNTWQIVCIDQLHLACPYPAAMAGSFCGPAALRPCIMDSLAKANGTFAIQVLKMLCQDRPSQNVLFSPLSISSALAMVLLGAKGNTKDQIAQGDEWPVQMMWQEANFNFIYISEAQTKVLELPYAGKTLSMIILLPDEDVDLSVVENNLTFEKFIAWTKAASLQNIEVEVFLPRFKLQEDYEMKSVLQRLGMVDAFQPGQAELSAMSTETDLCLSKVVHKSVMEVNEEGTEAVAATGIVIVEDCSECIPTFHADHPFLFFIRHNETNTVLFCGRFSSP
uniref:serpin B9-like n=1 Tax=Ictidomys tridecemlineatus TaxID=43179 RepID=UPI001A9DF7D7|nr:serpin B9-like [Ictidomys tridecemlineatus]